MSARSRSRAGRLVANAVSWAHARDPDRVEAELEPRNVGWIAQVWATLKLGVVGMLSPFWAPALMFRAAINNRRAQGLIRSFPAQVRAIAAGRTPAAPSNHVIDVPAAMRLAIFSDLHRCVPGRLDWPARQNTKRLYELVLDAYADDDWSLCENGDIEDYWIVGGSAYGTVYDALRMLGGVLARYGRTSLLTEVYRAHLDEIVANNEGIYHRVRDRFVPEGRFYRTVGNHDSPNRRPELTERLRQHLGKFPIADYFALRGDRGELVGLICHGHHTDGWNAPERDNLGKLSAWIANTLIDVPKLETPEGLPPPGFETQMLAGELADRMITVNPTFGANSSYDSLDEELLFDAMYNDGLDDVWLLMGHTHFPLSSPVARDGRRWTRYLNSGCGVADELITAIEWDGTGVEPTAHLVAWTLASSESPADNVVTTAEGHRLARFVLEPDGDRLRPTADVGLRAG